MLRLPCITACLAVLLLTPPVWPQAPASAPADDPLGLPTQRGLRLTPEMARAITKRIVQETAGHYELDKSKHDEAAELLARRLMAAAHATDGKANELVEWTFCQTMNFATSEQRGQGRNLMTPEFQAGMAERLLPVVPAVKDLLRGVGQDIRPLLPFKQQLKLTGELALAGTALNAFEENMQRWARGEGTPDENPFQSLDAAAASTKKDAKGQTLALRQAREAAEKEANREALLKSVWSTYLEEAKKYYDLDAAQCATADSTLREYLDRARAMLKDPAWRDRYLRVRLLQQVVWRTRMTRSRFFNEILNQETTGALQPMDVLGDEFRAKIDEIPTQAQRTAAEARIVAALASHGYTESKEAQ